MTDDELKKKSAELIDKYALGPTGQYPSGKLNPMDQGEIKCAVGTEGDKVVIHFGKQVAWLALTPEQCIELAKILVVRAKALQESKR